jgi:hypothetical protein
VSTGGRIRGAMNDVVNGSPELRPVTYSYSLARGASMAAQLRQSIIGHGSWKAAAFVNHIDAKRLVTPSNSNDKFP